MPKSLNPPFNKKPYQNVSEITLTDNSVYFYDAYLDDMQHTCSRMGLSQYFNVGTNFKPNGLYWWDSKQLWVIVSDGHVYTLDRYRNFAELTGTDLLSTKFYASFVDNGDFLVIASGGPMLYTDGTPGAATFITSINAPNNVSHVAFFNNFIIANEVGTQRFYFAEFVGAPTTWYVQDVYSAEGNPDVVISLFVNMGILIIVGTQTIEFWTLNSDATFSRLGGTVVQRGGMSPNSNAIVDGVFFFFDYKKRFCYIEGVNVVELSTPFDRVIQSLSYTDDCTIYYATPNGKHFIIVQFPSADRCFVYDISQKAWYEWTYWDNANNKRRKFLGLTYAYSPSLNTHLVGSWVDGKLYEINEKNVNDNGVQIKTEFATAFYDYGSPQVRKRSYYLTMRLERGVGNKLDPSEAPMFRLMYRDVDRWGNVRASNWLYGDLGKIGDEGLLLTFQNLGSFYARQYILQSSGNVQFVLGDVSEMVDVYEF